MGGGVGDGGGACLRSNCFTFAFAACARQRSSESRVAPTGGDKNNVLFHSRTALRKIRSKYLVTRGRLQGSLSRVGMRHFLLLLLLRGNASRQLRLLQRGFISRR